jgi:hypothetical protein
LTQLVQNLNNKIHSAEFLEQHRKSDKDFTRNRSLTFPRLITFMLNMVNGSLQSELNRFFQVVHDCPVAVQSVTAAALCKARKKFSHTAFKALNQTLVQTFYDSANIKRWKGFRLLAVDGSVVQLPEKSELFERFGQAGSFSYNPSVRFSQLYDVKNKLTVDMQIEPYRTSERDLAVRHLECANPNDLILYDRGYPATWMFILHKQKRVNFCMRTVVDVSKISASFYYSDDDDIVVSMPCTEKSLRRCRKDGLPIESIDVRLVKVRLASGITEVLMTSLLDQETYPLEIFKDLYHQRWGIEEDYKLLKSRLDLENYSGYSEESVLQDLHAKVLTKNITAVAIFEAEEIKEERCKHRKLKYRINTTHALSQLKDNIVRLLLNTSAPDLSGLLINCISKVTDAYRPERSYKRESKRKNWKKYPMAYKRIA